MVENQNGVAKANENIPVTPQQKTIADQVLQKINLFKSNGELRIHPGYAPENALRSALLILSETKDRSGNYVLNTCTKESIANTLLNMVVQGLSPVKRQCSFIAYGNQLSLQREYAGSIAMAKRYGMKSIKANAVFEGDELKYEIDPDTGNKKIISHIQSLDNMGGLKLKGAYAIVEMEDGTKQTEIMNIAQIQKAWEQGPMKGNSPAHKNFPDQMACKTVINRACKLIINSSDDTDLFDEEERTDDVVSAHVKNQIEQNANKSELAIDEEGVITEHEEVATSEPIKKELVLEDGITETNGQIKAPF